MKIMNHEEFNTFCTVPHAKIDEPCTWSVQTARYDWADDEYNGTLAECEQYIRENYAPEEYTDSKRVRIALIEVTNDATFEYCHDEYYMRAA